MKPIIIFLISLFLTNLVFSGDLSITIYNNDRALVHEVREIDFAKGLFSFNFTDIPSGIIPTSVSFSADKVAIWEQNYEFDIASAQKIQEKFIGEKIQLFFEDGSMLEGALQSGSASGGLIIIDDEKRVKIISPDKLVHYDFPRMPENFVQRPTLIWLLNSETAGKRKAEVSYLTNGINWHAEYVAVVGEKALGFTGWVSIDNRSGAEYKEAKLKLIAGEVHTVEERRYGKGIRAGMVMEDMQAAPQFEEKAFFEYHLYTLQRPATVKNNQIKQISLFPEAEVKYEKKLLFQPTRGDNKVKVYIEYRNSAEAGLGMALPGGTVRIYQKDVDGSQEFIGEDRIEHTPRDEKVSLQVGNAFDIVGERIVENTRQLSRTEREEDIKISLRNHKAQTETVIVRENFWGNWKILNSTHPYEKINANQIEFKVSLPPHKENEETLIKYTIRYSNK
jgi:hypothetical protein